MTVGRRILTSLRRGRRLEEADGGFSLIEVIVALGLLMTVMATTAGFFTTSLKQSNGQTQAQEAAVLADQQLDYTRSVPVDALLSGRSQPDVAAAIANPPAGVDLSQDVTSTGNFDTANPPATTSPVPINLTTTVGGTKYTVTTFIDRCYPTAPSGAECRNPNAAPMFTPQNGWLYRITVDVTYALGGGRSCANGKACYYVASTLRDAGKTEPCFNVQVAYAGCSTSQPTITSISPNSVSTNTSTTITLGGTNFDTGATVSIDTGGTVSNVNITSTTQLTFTLTTDNTAAALGTRTIKVTNPNGKFAYGTLTITTARIKVSGVSPSPVTTGSTVTMTVAGSGFQNGSVVSIPATAGTIVGTPTITSNSITFSFTAGSSGAATGTWPVTITNPDGNSDSANFTIQQASITVTSVSPSTSTFGSTSSFTITGNGFNSGAQVTLDSSNVAGTWVNSSTITVALGSDPAAGTHVFTVTNPDGGSDTGTFTVTGGTAQITDISPPWIAHGSRVTVTITGTGFVASGSDTPRVTVDGSTSGVSSVRIRNSTKVTFRYRITSTTGIYTLPVQVTSKDGTVSDSYDWVVQSY